MNANVFELGSNAGLSPASFASPASWADVDPHSHLVQFYENDGFLIDSLTRWFADGLSASDSCVFVGTEAHRLKLEKSLAAQGVDTDNLIKQGRFLCRDASQTLSTFMVDEWPDEALFTRAIETVIARLTQAARDPRIRRDGGAPLG